MQEFIFTLVAFYILFKVLGSNGNVKVYNVKNYYSEPQKKKAGEITVEKKPEKKPKTSSSPGEYIDFEEVK